MTNKEMEAYDLEKLYDWLMDEKRQSAQTHFTSGVARNIAKEIQFRLSNPPYSSEQSISLSKDLFPYDGDDGLTIAQRAAFIKGLQHPTRQVKENWISVEDEKPPIPSGEDSSENVFAIVDGKVRIMAYCYIDGGDEEASGWMWCDCGQQIDGDPEFDDDYKPTHWLPLPTIPKDYK